MSDKARRYRRITQVGMLILTAALFGAAMLYYFAPPLEIGVFIIFAVIIIAVLGAGIAFLYSSKYFEEVSREEERKIDEFIREWERERWRKP